MMIMPIHTESNNKIEPYEYREQDKRGRRYLKEDKEHPEHPDNQPPTNRIVVILTAIGILIWWVVVILILFKYIFEPIFNFFLW